MSARSPVNRAAFALLWLVGALPQLAQADSFDVVPLPALSSSSEVATSESFKLRDCAQLPPASPRVEIPWRLQLDQNTEVVGLPPGEISPHITSVPVAAIVGGSLIASMGIAQRVRRTRSIRG